MDLPVDEPGVYRVALEVVCNQGKQAAKDKLTVSILAGKVSFNQPVSVSVCARDLLLLPSSQAITGVIADGQRFSSHESGDAPSLARLSIKLTTLGLNSEGAVVPVNPPYLLICGATDPSTPEGVARLRLHRPESSGDILGPLMMTCSSGTRRTCLAVNVE